jgi:hypothetical protein
VGARCDPEVPDSAGKEAEMAEELKVKIIGEIPEGAERSSVRARFAPDAAEDVKGQSLKWLKPAEDEDVEGQSYKWLKPAEDEDAEGNALKSHVLEIERDENGELIGRYVPAVDDDTEGHRWA